MAPLEDDGLRLQKDADGTVSTRALITGITGQDGSYLSELLLSKGYEVHGVVRRASTFNTERLEHLYRDPHEPGGTALLALWRPGRRHGSTPHSREGTSRRGVQPGAQSHVRVSFDEPEYTADAVATGTLRLLEALRDYGAVSGTASRYYQASSSEMFGSAPPPAERERPRFTRAARTPPARSRPTGMPSTTARPTAYSSPTASSSTTNRPVGARRSCRAKSRAPPRASSSAFKRSSTWATSMPGATGASLATTSRRCGSCSRPNGPTTT